jgi:predicted metal-dependent hydrolase
MTISRIQLGEITMELLRKDIKNIYLRVLPPAGNVRISAPRRMGMESIHAFATSKIAWIKKQQKRLQQQELESHREYMNGETHYVWGNRYLLTVSVSDEPTAVEIDGNHLFLRMRPGSDGGKRRAVVEKWHREQMLEAVPQLLARWQPLVDVGVVRFSLRHMRTRWGSCNTRTRSIRLNTELAKRPPECLEYIVVHELAHLLEPTHNAHFVGLMDRFMPNWKDYRNQLNRPLVNHQALALASPAV